MSPSSFVEPGEIGAHALERDDLGILGLQIEQIRFVRPGGAVADGIAHDKRYESMLDSVDGSRAHAAAGRHSGNQERVDTERSQCGGERRSEECARILLRDHDLAALRANARSKLTERRARAALEDFQRGHFAEEHAAVATAILVSEIGMQDRDAGVTRESEQFLAPTTYILRARPGIER